MIRGKYSYKNKRKEYSVHWNKHGNSKTNKITGLPTPIDPSNLSIKEYEKKTFQYARNVIRTQTSTGKECLVILWRDWDDTAYWHQFTKIKGDEYLCGSHKSILKCLPGNKEK